MESFLIDGRKVIFELCGDEVKFSVFTIDGELENEIMCEKSMVLEVIQEARRKICKLNHTTQDIMERRRKIQKLKQ